MLMKWIRQVNFKSYTHLFMKEYNIVLLNNNFQVLFTHLLSFYTNTAHCHEELSNSSLPAYFLSIHHSAFSLEPLHPGETFHHVCHWLNLNWDGRNLSVNEENVFLVTYDTQEFCSHVISLIQVLRNLMIWCYLESLP